jgi:hypothetical protein
MKKYYPIPSWENYGVSIDGDIARIKGGVRGAVVGKVLKTFEHKTRGYLTVRLFDKDRQKSFDVHRIVAMTFLGEIPKNMQVCHNNGIKTDCRLLNLRIDTLSSNQLDRAMHGTSNRGEKNGRNKHSVETILKVKKMLSENIATIKIFEITGVGVSQIRNIKNGYKWSWLTI